MNDKKKYKIHFQASKQASKQGTRTCTYVEKHGNVKITAGQESYICGRVTTASFMDFILECGVDGKVSKDELLAAFNDVLQVGVIRPGSFVVYAEFWGIVVARLTSLAGTFLPDAATLTIARRLVNAIHSTDCIRTEFHVVESHAQLLHKALELDTVSEQDLLRLGRIWALAAERLLVCTSLPPVPDGPSNCNESVWAVFIEAARFVVRSARGVVRTHFLNGVMSGLAAARAAQYSGEAAGLVGLRAAVLVGLSFKTETWDEDGRTESDTVHLEQMLETCVVQADKGCAAHAVVGMAMFNFRDKHEALTPRCFCKYMALCREVVDAFVSLRPALARCRRLYWFLLPGLERALNWFVWQLALAPLEWLNLGIGCGFVWCALDMLACHMGCSHDNIIFQNLMDLVTKLAVYHNDKDKAAVLKRVASLTRPPGDVPIMPLCEFVSSRITRLSVQVQYAYEDRALMFIAGTKDGKLLLLRLVDDCARSRIWVNALARRGSLSAHFDWTTMTCIGVIERGRVHVFPITDGGAHRMGMWMMSSLQIAWIGAVVRSAGIFGW